MTDKIKVWKCDECNNANPCILGDISYDMNPAYCVSPEIPGTKSNWQPTTEYQITERIPTTPDEIEEKFGKRMGDMARSAANAAPVEVWPLTPPRRRVKIIWSEVTAENVEIAHALKWMDGDILRTDAKTFMSGYSDGSKLIQISDIPPTWLEDVVDGPVSAEEWIKYIVELEQSTQSFKEVLNDEYYPVDFRKSRLLYILKRVAKDGLKQGEQNQRLRTKPQQTFDEWVHHMYPDWTAQQKAYARIVWTARGEASEKERYRQHQTLEESKKVFTENYNWNDDHLDALEFGWNARGDSHNLPTEPTS